jgi:hypothetical protein
VSRARLVLHLAALFAPFAAAAAFSLLVNRTDHAAVLNQTLIFGSAGAIPAQFAALLRWRALDRRAHEPDGGWQTGIGMAALTHAGFGITFDAALVASTGWKESMGTGRVSDLALQSLFFAFASLMPLGAFTFPFTALLTQQVAGMRRRELAREPG